MRRADGLRLPVLLGATVVTVAAATGLAWAPGVPVDAPVTMSTSLAIGFLPLGLFLLAARPGNRVAVVVCGVGLLAMLALAAAGWSTWTPAAWLAQWAWWPPIALIPVALLIFPDGRLPSRRWRVLGWLLTASGGGAALAFAAAAAYHPRTLLTVDTAPVTRTAQVLLNVAAGLAVLTLLAAACVVVATAGRVRGAGTLERRQLACLVPAGILLIVGVGLDAAGVPYAIVPGVLGLPAGMAVAIMQYRLDDLDLLVNRSLVWLAMTVVILATFSLAVLGTGQLLLQDRPLVATALGTGLVAALFDPVRRRVQRATDRLLFGEREEPYAVLARLGERMQAAADPGVMLARTTEALTEALRVPYARIVVQTGDEPLVASEHGRPVLERVRFPMELHGESVGYLEVSPRRSEEAFNSRERALLRGVATQAAMAARAHELTLALRRSRERLVVAREEERLRLRRDLHDGLGPALAGTRMQVSAAATLVPGGPAEEVLRSALEDLARCTGEVRRLVDGLRPAVLDRGLEQALRDTASGLLSGLSHAVRVEGRLDGLPAAVEVATFRIATEAMTNVVKHARAERCEVTLTSAGTRLRVQVRDDGVGGAAARDGGVGVGSMAARAEELGGALSIDSRNGGTVVTADLPLPRSGDGRTSRVSRAVVPSGRDTRDSMLKESARPPGPARTSRE